MICEGCGHKECSKRQLFYVDYFGDKHYLEEYKYICDICWKYYCLMAD